MFCRRLIWKFGQVFNVAGDDHTPKELAALIGEAKLLELSTEIAEAVPDDSRALGCRGWDICRDTPGSKPPWASRFLPMKDLVDGIMTWCKKREPTPAANFPQRYEKKAASGANAPPPWLPLYWRIRRSARKFIDFTS